MKHREELPLRCRHQLTSLCAVLAPSCCLSAPPCYCPHVAAGRSVAPPSQPCRAGEAEEEGFDDEYQLEDVEVGALGQLALLNAGTAECRHCWTGVLSCRCPACARARALHALFKLPCGWQSLAFQPNSTQHRLPSPPTPSHPPPTLYSPPSVYHPPPPPRSPPPTTSSPRLCPTSGPRGRRCLRTARWWTTTAAGSGTACRWGHTAGGWVPGGGSTGGRQGRGKVAGQGGAEAMQGHRR